MLSVVLLSALAHADQTHTDQKPPSVTQVNYLPPSLSADRQDYELEVTRAALDATVKSHGPYRLVSTSEQMNLLRSVREIARGEIVNIGTNPLSSEWLNDDINIIPLPLMKGLLGYRAMIVRKKDLERLSKIDNIEEFKKLKPGQLEFWTDISIYEANGFEVVKGPSMDVLFSMLERERFDYIPLGVGEVEKIFGASQGAYPELAILKGTYLYYPFPVYTYVCACEPELGQRMKAGLTLINNNGQLNTLFTRQFGDALDKIKARQSKIFRIENASIPADLLPPVLD